jgi:DNA-binding NarL/FixJ family response regulator
MTIRVFHIENDSDLRYAIEQYLENGLKVDLEVEGYMYVEDFLKDLTAGCRADVYIIGELLSNNPSSTNKVNGFDVIRQIRSVCPDAKTIGLIKDDAPVDEFRSLGATVVHIGHSPGNIADVVLALTST